MKKDTNHWERYREIGFRIAYCRKYQKMTQEELAEKLNVSRQHIGAIEAPNVNRKISLDLIFDIADILNVGQNIFWNFRIFRFKKHRKRIAIAKIKRH